MYEDSGAIISWIFALIFLMYFCGILSKAPIVMEKTNNNIEINNSPLILTAWLKVLKFKKKLNQSDIRRTDLQHVSVWWKLSWICNSLH